MLILYFMTRMKASPNAQKLSKKRFLSKVTYITNKSRFCNNSEISTLISK